MLAAEGEQPDVVGQVISSETEGEVIVRPLGIRGVGHQFMSY